MPKSQVVKRHFNKEIKRISDVIVKKYKPKKVILFGSCANGKLKPSSDIDIMIIKNTRKKHVERIKEVLSMVDSKLPMDVLVYTPKEFKKEIDLGEFIFQDINKEGKLLYDQK